MLPALLMAGGAAGGLLGAFGQRRAAKRAAKRYGALSQKVGLMYDEAADPLRGLLGELEGVNYGQRGAAAARAAGVGFDRGTFEAGAAMRGVTGRNQYAMALQNDQISREAALGQTSLEAALQLEDQGMRQRAAVGGTLADIMGQKAGAIAGIEGARIGARQQAGSAFSGFLSQIGGAALGAGATMGANKWLSNNTNLGGGGNGVAQGGGINNTTSQLLGSFAGPNPYKPSYSSPSWVAGSLNARPGVGYNNSILNPFG